MSSGGASPAPDGGSGGNRLFAGISEEQTRQLFLVLAVVLAAGAAMLAFLFGMGLVPGRFRAEAMVVAEAVALASGRGFSHVFGPEAVASVQPPLLPLLLVPAVWLGGAQAAGQIAGAAAWVHGLAAVFTLAFVLLAYGTLRRLLDLPPVVCFAATAGLAMHPVVARFGGAALADTLAGALALGALLLAARADARTLARAWASPGERVLAPVVVGGEGPVVIGPGGVLEAREALPGGSRQDAGASGRSEGGSRSGEHPEAPASSRPHEIGPGAGELAGIAVIPRQAPEEPTGLAGLWHRFGLHDWWPVTLVGALAALARYEAIVAVLAIGLALATRKRWREAIGVVGFTALLLLPWAAWAAWTLAHWPAWAGDPAAPLAADTALKNFPAALWQGLGRVLPGLLIPQAFIAGYPLGTEGAPHMARIPTGIVAFWGLMVSLSLVGPLWRLRSASAPAARAAAFFALGTLAAALVAAGLDPTAGWDFVARALLPAAPLFVASVWMWKAGEHRFERAAAEKFKGLVALGWLAAVILFSPVSLGPVREDVKRAREFQAEQAALWTAIREFTAESDVVAAVRPAAVWLGTGRRAVDLPLAAPDLPEAVRKAGATWLVSEPVPRGPADPMPDALTKAAAAEPDWARLVFTSPGGRLALFRIAEP